MEKSNKISVIGSANYDIFISVERTPEVGETIASKGLKTACGGKGANQAAAIGKLGYPVDFIFQVGKDTSGDTLTSELKKYNVNVEYGKVLDNQTSGQAFILTYPNHDNSIVIVGGANMDWENNDLEGLKQSLSTCTYTVNI